MAGNASIDTSPVVEILNPQGTGAALILCEHASNHIPEKYHGLGLSADARQSHAAWDPGARAVSLNLSKALDAPLVASRISRLVYDCNRPPEAASAMPEKSELIEVPGNRNLSAADRAERTQSIYTPFCQAVTDMIAARQNAGLSTALITIHSFTPIYFGIPRDVEIGILHDSDTQLGDAMLARAAQLPHRQVLRNQPYGPADGVTHSLKIHGLAHGLPNVMIELRNDLLQNPADESTMTDELLTLLRPALADLAPTPKGTARA